MKTRPFSFSFMSRPFLLLLVALVIPGGPGLAQSIPIDSLLTPDGRLRRDLSGDGSVDMKGWTMILDAGGSPRFFRGAEGAEPKLLAADVPGDECWVEGFGPGGIYGKVNVISVRGTELYIGGLFRLAGSVVANNLVRYSTSDRIWSIVGDDAGEGTNGAVYALAWVGNDLYVGGRFSRAGATDAHGIARWNSAANRWFPVGSGVRNDVDGWPFVTPYGGVVHALAATSEGLFVGGDFDEAGGKRIHNMARWNYDASEWTFPCRVEEEEPNGPVYALLLHDSTVYVGGAFTALGSVQALNVASIQVIGGNFQPLGGGIDGDVRALAWHDGALYAGGGFDNAGGGAARNIARWSGSAWSAVGSGTDGPVLALASTPTRLIVGGQFRRAGGLGANGVAEWDAGEWRALAEGMSGGIPSSVASVVEVGGRIIAGGNFTTAGTTPVGAIARWDTSLSAWFGLSDTAIRSFNGVNGNIFTMALHGDNLYVGGDFDRIGDVAAIKVARFNRASEEWLPLGAGITGPSSFVRSMAVEPDGDVYVGGIFTEAGGVAAVGIARWDGTSWSPVGGGVDGPTPYVFSLAIDGTNLYAGGAFQSAGGVPSPRVARYNLTTATWSGVGGGVTGDTTYAFVASVLPVGTDLYVGGLFHKAGGSDMSFIARWDGASWRELEAGVNGPVSAIIADGTDLMIGGEFTRAGNQDIPYLARWNGTTWSSPGGAPDGPVRSIARLGNDVIIGGEFAAAGGTPLPYIAIGSGGPWRGLGGAPNGAIRAIQIDRGDVIVGGDFVELGNVRANHVARLSPSGWSALGSDPRIGLSSPVLAMALRGSDLYVGGGFRTSGGLAVNGIARWNGSRWLTVGDGIRGGSGPEVRALAFAPDGDLYVGGRFDSAGAEPARGIARWDGLRWSPLGEGVTLNAASGLVNTLYFDADTLYVGGRFARAGTADAASLARWHVGSGAWSGVTGGDIRNTDDSPGEVRAIARHEGRLYVGGAFGKVGAALIANLAEGETETGAWIAPRPGTRSVTALASDGTTMFAAASYSDTVRDIIGNIQAIVPWRILLRLQAGTWTRVDSSFGRINALAFSPRGELFVGGRFVGIGPVASAGVVRYDNGNWLGLGSGVKDVVVDTSTFGQSVGDSIFTLGDADVFALAPLENGAGAWVGGQFKVAGTHPSLFIGAWIKCGTLDAPDASPTSEGRARLRLNVVPNPASRHADVRFHLDRPARVVVSIVSTRGEIIIDRDPIDLDSGEQTISLDVTSLPAGSYFCRLSAGARVTIAPIVIVR